jgi:hypothetical protein
MIAATAKRFGMIGTRRQLIRLVAGILAALPLGRPAHAISLDDMAGLRADADAAAAIGDAYLRAQPTPRPTLQALQAAVAAALTGDAPLKARFRTRVQADFAAARVVMVDGWMLSRVEAQTCAITYLNFVGEV